MINHRIARYITGTGGKTIALTVASIILTIAFVGISLLPNASTAVIVTACIVGAAMWMYFCSRAMFPALCVVILIGMVQGLVKQKFDWSVVAYGALDAPWALFVLVWVVRRIATQQTKRITAVDCAVILFLVWSAVEVFNPNLRPPIQALAAVRSRLMPIAFYWIGKELVDRDRARTLLLITLTMAGIGGVFGAYEWKIGLEGVSAWGHGFEPRTTLSWSDGHGEGHFRPLSIYQDAGLAAAFSTLMFLAAINYTDLKNRHTQALVMLAGLGCALFVALSGVRTAVLIAVIGIFVSAMLNWRRTLPVFGLITVAIVIMGFLNAQKMAKRYETITDPVAAYQSNRGFTWALLPRFVERYPMGVGTGSATGGGEMFARIFDLQLENSVNSTDNGIIDYLSEGGIPLVALFFSLMLIVGVSAWKTSVRYVRVRPVAQVVLVFCIIASVMMATGDMLGYQPFNLIFWTLLGSMIAQEQRESEVAVSREAVLEETAYLTGSTGFDLA